MTANQITVFLDPAAMPSRLIQDQQTFDNLVAAVFAAFPTFGAQFNAGIANFNAAAAGSAYAIPYTIDLSGTTDVDPGAGKLRFDNATQNLAATLRLDLLGANSVDYTAMLDTFDASTSTVKGAIRIVKQGDASKFLLFNVNSRTAPSGYRDISVTPVASTSANPFVTGDAVLLFFQRNGDKGLVGGFQNLVVISSTGTWQPPAGVTKAEITVIDGGNSGPTNTTTTTAGGAGGAASVSIITVDPAVTYTATIGAGGVAGAAGTNISAQTGGASSFSGTGITTLTSASGSLKVPGGSGGPGYSSPAVGGLGGGSLYAPPAYATAPTGYGGGGPGTTTGSAGYSGKAGAVIIRY